MDAAVFVQDEARLGGNLKGEAGFRADYHDATTAQSEFVVSPKIGASLRLSNSVTMRSSIGAGYRAPSAIEQFVNTFQFGFQVLPNPLLQGERSWSAEVGTSAVLWNRLQIDAAVFGSRYSNLIGPAAHAGKLAPHLPVPEHRQRPRARARPRRQCHDQRPLAEPRCDVPVPGQQGPGHRPAAALPVDSSTSRAR